MMRGPPTLREAGLNLMAAGRELISQERSDGSLCTKRALFFVK